MLLPVEGHLRQRPPQLRQVPDNRRTHIGGAGEELAVATEGDAADLPGAAASPTVATANSDRKSTRLNSSH